MKLCEGFGTPIIADRIYDKHRLLSWVVFILRKYIDNIFLKPSWGSNQIKHVCVDRINAISIWYQFSVCTIYGPAAQYVFNIDNLLKGQLLDSTFFNCPLVFLFKYQILRFLGSWTIARLNIFLIVHWCFCSNTRYLGFLVFWSYKLFFLSFWPKKLRSHDKRWVTTQQKGIFKYIRSK